MAEKLNVLKARIKAITGTHKITKTMDMISRSKTAKILTVEQGINFFWSLSLYKRNIGNCLSDFSA